MRKFRAWLMDPDPEAMEGAAIAFVLIAGACACWSVMGSANPDTPGTDQETGAPPPPIDAAYIPASGLEPEHHAMVSEPIGSVVGYCNGCTVNVYVGSD